MAESSNKEMICPVCKKSRYIKPGKSATSVYSTILYKLKFCEHCNHLFLLNTRLLNELYETRYNYESHLAIEKEKKWRAGKIVKCIKQFIDTDATIVDVGCMYGFMLDVFRDSGYLNLVGIEIDKLAADTCSNKGHEVFNGTLSEWAHANPDKFNSENICIILSHVVEHIEDINDFFNLLKCIASESCLLVVVPNSSSTTVRLFKKYWGWWQVPAHLQHFSKKSLSSLLINKEFEIKSVLTRGADSLFWISTLASLLNIKSKTRCISSFQRLVIRIFSFLFKYWFFIGNEEITVVARKM